MIYLLIWLLLISLILNVFDNYKKQHTKPTANDVEAENNNSVRESGGRP